MRPSHALPGVGTLRELTIWKAFVLSILTLGIYFLVVTYQNAKDIQNAREKPFDYWLVFFWLGIPFFPLMFGVYIVNGIGLQEIRRRTGQRESSVWIAAVILAALFPIIGELIWATYFNDSLRTASRGIVQIPAPAGSPLPTQAYSRQG